MPEGWAVDGNGHVRDRFGRDRGTLAEYQAGQEAGQRAAQLLVSQIDAVAQKPARIAPRAREQRPAARRRSSSKSAASSGDDGSDSEPAAAWRRRSGRRRAYRLDEHFCFAGWLS